jgi:hypothetical protein
MNSIDLEHGPAARWRVVAWGTAAALLLAPWLAMQFDAPGVHWTGFDFLVMGAMLATACGLWELGLRLSRHRAYRAAVAIAVVGGFLMTWIDLAVGIIGDERNPLNLMFFGVLAVGLVGALVVRFRAAGMVYALVGMAIAQAVVAVVTLAVGEMTFVLSVFFAAAWLASAALFRKAARDAA